MRVCRATGQERVKNALRLSFTDEHTTVAFESKFKLERATDARNVCNASPVIEQRPWRGRKKIFFFLVVSPSVGSAHAIDGACPPHCCLSLVVLTHPLHLDPLSHSTARLETDSSRPWIARRPRPRGPPRSPSRCRQPLAGGTAVRMPRLSATTRSTATSSMAAPPVPLRTAAPAVPVAARRAPCMSR